MKRLFGIIILSLILVLSGCASSDESEKNYNEDGGDNSNPPTDEPSDPSKDPGGEEIDSSNHPALENRKIIYTVDLGMVSTSPSETYQSIMEQVSTYDAFIESEEINTTIYKITIRVKSDSLSDLVNAIQADGETVKYSRSSQDITNSYSTLEARLSALETQHARILELIEASEDLNDILQLEEKRAEIEAQLNQIGLKLNSYDSLIEYSTIHLTISKIEDINALLDDTHRPKVFEETIGTNSVTVRLNNSDDQAVTMTVNVFHDGKIVQELQKEVYRDSEAFLKITDLKAGNQYRIEVISQAKDHSPSAPDVLDVKTEDKFLTSVADVFMMSLDALVSFLRFIALAIVAILPFAVLFTITIGIPLKVYFNRKKNKKPKPPKNQKKQTQQHPQNKN